MALNDPAASLVSADIGGGSFRVNRSAYKSPDIFQQEKERIFTRCWLYLAHGSEVRKAGDFVTREIGGREIIFLRGRDGKAGAYYNSCPHRGAQLCRERSGAGRVITCPYHGWVFNADGKLITQNAEFGYADGLNDDGHLDLMRVARLEEYRGFYFVNFNPNAISLVQYLAGATDIIDAVCDQTQADMIILPGEHVYSIRANYKLLVENSYDGYHLESVHASYIDHMRDVISGTPTAAQFFETSIKQMGSHGQARALGKGHGVLESYVPSGRPVASWLPSMGFEVKPEIEARRAGLIARLGEERGAYIADTQKNLIVFPNFVLNDIGAITVRYIEPESVNFMRISSWALGPSDESDLLRQIRLDNYISFLGPAGFGSPDDIEMLEMSQRGMEKSPIEWTELSKGMGADDRLTASGTPLDEVQMQAYWSQWDRIMRGADTLEV